MAFLQANAFHCSHQWLLTFWDKGLFGTSLYHKKNYNFMASVPGCFRFLSLSTLMSLARFVTECSHFYWMTFRCWDGNSDAHSSFFQWYFTIQQQLESGPPVPWH